MSGKTSTARYWWLRLRLFTWYCYGFCLGWLLCSSTKGLRKKGLCMLLRNCEMSVAPLELCIVELWQVVEVMGLLWMLVVKKWLKFVPVKLVNLFELKSVWLLLTSAHERWREMLQTSEVVGPVYLFLLYVFSAVSVLPCLAKRPQLQSRRFWENGRNALCHQVAIAIHVWYLYHYKTP